MWFHDISAGSLNVISIGTLDAMSCSTEKAQEITRIGEGDGDGDGLRDTCTFLACRARQKVDG